MPLPTQTIMVFLAFFTIQGKWVAAHLQQGALWGEYDDGLSHEKGEADGHEGGVPREEVAAGHRRVHHQTRQTKGHQVEHHSC